MKIYILIFTACCSFYLSAAQSCESWETENQPGNLPPGCRLATTFFQGDTKGYTNNFPAAELFPCGKIDNSQFLTINADLNGTIRFDFRTYSCAFREGVELVFYDINFNLVSPCFEILDQTEIVVENLTPSDTYFLMIDPKDGDECNFWINGYDTEHLEGLTPPSVLSNKIGNRICTGNQICFFATPPDIFQSFPQFEWKIPPNARLITGGDNFDKYACMVFEEEGFGIGTAAIVYSNRKSMSAPFFAFVEPVRKSVSKIICQDEFVEMNGKKFNKNGIYEIVFENINGHGCDSVVTLDLTVPDTSPLEVNCFVDTFINAITVDWKPKPQANFYEISINDTLAATQSHRGYIFKPQPQKEDFKISVQPMGTHACNYLPGIIHCPSPDTVNISKNAIVENLLIFPNPSENEVEIFTKLEVEKTEIIDASGKKVKEVTDKRIDLSEFDSGIYFFKIHLVNEVILKKVVKI